MMQCAAFVMARTWRQEARRRRWARLLSPSQAPSGEDYMYNRSDDHATN